MTRRLALLVAMTLSVAGCGGHATATSPTTTSSVVSPAGSWSGSINDAISGEGTMRLSLSDQAQNSLTGTWSATFKSGDSFSGLAVAGPSASNGYFIMLYVEPAPPCAIGSGPGASAPLSFTLINLVITSSRLTAVTGRLSCSSASPAFGAVDLSKQ